MSVCCSFLRIAKAEKAASEERTARELAEFTKAADDKYPKLPGTSAAKGKAMAELSKCSAETQETVEKMLAAAEGSLKMAFGDVGETDGTTEKTAKGDAVKKGQAFLTKVDELQASQKLNRMDAISKARKQFPEEFKEYQEADAA
jgi:hypothetical protein